MKWLHLSDLHLIYKNYDTEIMRDSFIDYLQQNFRHNIDILFITGDITHQGQQYTDEVINFLNEIVTVLNITKDKIYMIPGNHDIKRNPLMGHVIKSILQSDDPKEAINGLDEVSYNVLYDGQSEFIDMYERFLGRPYPKDDLHFVIKQEDYNVLHINTCLVAGGDDVEGKILIGLQKLFRALKDLEKEKVVFALGHHTTNCINVSEKHSFLNRLSDSEVDFYLCGHVHKSELYRESNNYRTTHMFTAGANVVDNYSDTVFIEGVIGDDGATNIIYHSWNASNEFWHINNTIDRRLATGKYEISLEKFLKKEIKTADLTKASLAVIDRGEFRNFIIDFSNILSSENLGDYQENFIPNDVTGKFEDMLCSSTFRKRYDNYSIYFPIVNQIFKSSSFVGFEKKHLVPSLISKFYMKVLYKYNNGDEIFVAMTESMAEKYVQQMEIAEEVLEIYLSILVCWGIHECDIYNENKKGVS